jgi:hypothetical protein
MVENILTISTVILAVLISLKIQKINTSTESFFYLFYHTLSGNWNPFGVITIFLCRTWESSVKKEESFKYLLLDKEIDNVNRICL